jgi:hypothetical protein
MSDTATLPPVKPQKVKPVHEFRVNYGAHIQSEPRQAFDSDGEPLFNEDGSPTMMMKDIQYPAGSIVQSTKRLDKKFNQQGYPPHLSRIGHDREDMPEVESITTSLSPVQPAGPQPPSVTLPNTDLKKVAGAVPATGKSVVAAHDTFAHMTRQELIGVASDEEIKVDESKDTETIRTHIKTVMDKRSKGIDDATTAYVPSPKKK